MKILSKLMFVILMGTTSTVVLANEPSSNLQPLSPSLADAAQIFQGDIVPDKVVALGKQEMKDLTAGAFYFSQMGAYREGFVPFCPCFTGTQTVSFTFAFQRWGIPRTVPNFVPPTP